MRHRRRHLFPAAFTSVASLAWIAAISPGAAWAQQPESHAKLDLIAEAHGGSVTSLGILFKLDPGWHIYWRNAGDSGEPPKVQWDLPAGLTAGDIRWPTPVRLGSGSVIDYGYEGQVLLVAPIKRNAAAKDESDAKAIEADVRYVVCREICIPGKAQLHITKDHNEQQTELLFAQARKALPQKVPAGWRVSAAQDKNHVVLTVRTGGNVTNATFFPLDPGVIENSAPQQFAQVAGGVRLTLKKSDQLMKPVDLLRGLISTAPDKSFELGVAVAAAGGTAHSK